MADSERRVVYRRAVPLSNGEVRDVQRVTRVYQSNDPLDANLMSSRNTPYVTITNGTAISSNDPFHQGRERSSRSDRTERHVDTGNAIHHLRDGLHELFSGEKPHHTHTSSSITRGREVINDAYSTGLNGTRLYAPSDRSYDRSLLYGREGYEVNDVNDLRPRQVYAGHGRGFDQPSTFVPAPTAASSASSGLRMETGSVAANLQRSRLGYLANPLVDPEADTRVHSNRDSFSSSFRNRSGRVGSRRSEATNGSLGSAMDYDYGVASRSPARDDLLFADNGGRIVSRSAVTSFKPLVVESVGTNGNYTTAQVGRDQREMLVSPRRDGMNGTTTHSEGKMGRWMHTSGNNLSCGHVSPTNESEKLQMERLHDNNLQNCDYLVVTPRNRLNRDNREEVERYARDVRSQYRSRSPSPASREEYSEELGRWVAVPTASVLATEAPPTVVIINGKNDQGKVEAIVVTDDARIRSTERGSEARRDIRERVIRSRENARRYLEDRERLGEKIVDSVDRVAHDLDREVKKVGHALGDASRGLITAYSGREASSGRYTDSDWDSDRSHRTFNSLTDEEVEEVLDDAYIMGFSDFD